ncbi:MAG TPA: hypothetical protein VHK69_16485 [Chitinophagaceae bacterium]|jgi:hypothetical protein|nr:hypothetical protein [Chitinophagaceae bacterium]
MRAPGNSYKRIGRWIGFSFFCLLAHSGQAQLTLWFGTVSAEGKTTQARFEVDSSWQSIVYAPYGRTPVAFTGIEKTGGQLSFHWQYNGQPYRCTLLKEEGDRYRGNCTGSSGASIGMVMRTFNPEDAVLQGNSLKAGATDLQILDRALALLNGGRNWSRSANRVCDNSTYPYSWSLFCALHQASIDVDVEYRHLRPALQAVRQAIEEAAAGKKFAHMLQDFNASAPDFGSIAAVLNRGKAILEERIKKGQ